MTPSDTSGGGAVRQKLRAVKQLVRDVEWRIRARSIVNPPLTRPVESLLFVCKGNICRSPFAGLLAERLSLDLPPPRLTVASAGIEPSLDGACPREAIDAARKLGIAMEAHRPRPIDAAFAGRFDMIVVMEAEQQQTLQRRYPQLHDRIVLLALFDADGRPAYERCNIADPFGKPVAAFDACYQRIDAAVRGLLKSLSATAAQGRAR
jgi:protein-tyrosine phosphatase